MSSPENLAEFRWNAPRSPHKSHLKAPATSPLTHLSLLPCFPHPGNLFVHLHVFPPSLNLKSFHPLIVTWNNKRLTEEKAEWLRAECGEWPELTTMTTAGFSLFSPWQTHTQIQTSSSFPLRTPVQLSVLWNAYNSASMVQALSHTTAHTQVPYFHSDFWNVKWGLTEASDQGALLW